jgi:hypothetical protein
MQGVITLKLAFLGFLLLSGYAIWRWTMEEKALIEWGDGKYHEGRDQDSTDIWRGDHRQ